MSMPSWLGKVKTAAPPLRYWFRTPMGLEGLAMEEIEAALPVSRSLQSHRNVFVQLSPDHFPARPELVRQLRQVDDAFDYWGCCTGIDRSKASVRGIASFLPEALAAAGPDLAAADFIRPTVSFVGKRNFNRFFVEEQIAQLIRQYTALKILSNEKKDGKVNGELRLRCHIEDDTAYFGLGLQDTPLHRRSWRGLRYTGQLHTTVAAAMARVLSVPEGNHVIDPFCGSGTILIESALLHPTCTHEGRDIREAALEIARQSAEKAGVDPVFRLGDTLKDQPGRSDFFLLSNPPWDEKHQIADGRLGTFINTLKTYLEKSRSAVLLLPKEMAVLLEAQLDQPLDYIATTRVRGKLAEIVKYSRGPKG